MRWRALLVALLALAGRAHAGENRMWVAALQLDGPLDGVEIDCGEAGRTRLALALLAGERRELELPLPVRSPLGVAGLDAVPPPRVDAVGAGPGGAASFVEWRTAPTVERLLAGSVGLRQILARTRPAVGDDSARGPGVAALVLLVAASAAVFAARRRPPLALAIGAVGAGAQLALGIALADAPSPGVRLIDLDLAQRDGVEVHAARDELALAPGAVGLLELAPRGGAVDFEGWTALGRAVAHRTARDAGAGRRLGAHDGRGLGLSRPVARRGGAPGRAPRAGPAGVVVGRASAGARGRGGAPGRDGRAHLSPGPGLLAGRGLGKGLMGPGSPRTFFAPHAGCGRLSAPPERGSLPLFTLSRERSEPPRARAGIGVSMKTSHIRAQDTADRWYVYDASEHVLGRMASDIAVRLMGKDRPEYTASELGGAHVVVINSAKARVSGKKDEQKSYQRYSGYPGGLHESDMARMRDRRPNDIVKLAVRRMLPKTRLGKSMLSRLKVYSGEEHRHSAQSPIKIEALGQWSS
jgi:large subunit ribosomal protein L13